MKNCAPPISLAGSQLGENSDEEEYRVLLPVIQDGLKCGENAVHVLNPAQCPDHLQCRAGRSSLSAMA